MATSRLHWVGVLLLFITSMLLLFVTISAPIINDLGFLRLQLINGTDKNHLSAVYFGTFGWCTTNTAVGDAYCEGNHVGYDIARIVNEVGSNDQDFDNVSSGTADSLTRVMVLHPIACGFAFITFLISLGAGVVGSLIGGLVAFVTWILIIIAMACDFTIFGIVRHHVRHDSNSLTRAYYGSASWLLVAAFLIELLGMIIVLFTAFKARRKNTTSRGETRSRFF